MLQGLADGEAYALRALDWARDCLPGITFGLLCFSPPPLPPPPPVCMSPAPACVSDVCACREAPEGLGGSEGEGPCRPLPIPNRLGLSLPSNPSMVISSPLWMSHLHCPPAHLHPPVAPGIEWPLKASAEASLRAAGDGLQLPAVGRWRGRSGGSVPRLGGCEQKNQFVVRSSRFCDVRYLCTFFMSMGVCQDLTHLFIEL